ncbi:gamma-glutamyltransferase family protein [Chitinophaga ginsengisegetis]|uniref:gamma-glutamyltransferase family protein n=1 Tax=Chitinophaga ginsengisegetis TaxID=393003 RepID=UPI000DBAAE2D|nr:gamma-glutamyltransferase [Chitinophaga ginsengisegetis]MDR6569547.1 gamma-glutamyltranspeptidase/glutathione hydrolase [Chitinophaga ginsengisegetis]MDR6649280.1 gamma-glutamyltranspeptidase/glutathione hydrolase [Chitinophaga ginsengisegetis]MDR6655630.1 gamma-glutamyltranspeptidase/glutathione hydrolase [Chitinophaga ginsengisegetis]
MKRFLLLSLVLGYYTGMQAQQTQKPPLHGKNWMAVTGKPLAATAGAMIFQQHGNAVDAACAMLAATCTMWDVLSWGGETQALIYNPKTGKVIAINALGVAPTGATPAFYKGKGYDFPPEYGPLAAVTPGTAGGLCYMLAEYGTLSLKQVLAPAMEMAAGYPIEAQTANSIERGKKYINEWPYSKAVFLTHPGEKREAPEAGEIFVQKDLLSTLTKMVAAEQEALRNHKSRKEAIMAAYDRFYKGDIAKEFVRGCQEQGGLITLEDLARWKPVEEEPLHINYKGIEVYKLQEWTQGPMLLQSLNILENFDLKSIGYNSTAYIHTLYQTMNLTFADRDFYYGDPAFNTNPAIKGLLSKEYGKVRAKQINLAQNDANAGPGDPYPFIGKTNPYLHFLEERKQLTDTSSGRQPGGFVPKHDATTMLLHGDAMSPEGDLNQLYAANTPDSAYMDRLWRGTTSVEAADKDGWVVSITPSGGWLPACIAGKTGIGMSQRAQSFVLDSAVCPFNVIAPGKRPRVTLTPSMALKDGKPFLAFGVQGGDTQDQNLLQFFLNVVEFGMTVQQATEAANINTNQLWLSLGGTTIKDREPRPGSILLNNNTSEKTRKALEQMGYHLTFGERTSGPINAIYMDRVHGSLWGGSSNHGEDYGIGW